MAAQVVNANSTEAQIEQLNDLFKPVAKSAGSFIAQDRRTTALLWTALERVYEFGETLLAMPGSPGVSIVREFLKTNKVHNKRSEINPYIGLVKLAFSDKDFSDSSRSQYSTVLHFANVSRVASSSFKEWLLEKGGIEGARKNALDALNSVIRQKNNQSRTSRLQKAASDLLARPASDAVALPSGVQAPEGFALVLAKIDGSNQASIINVVHSDAEKVDPVLLSLFEGEAHRVTNGAIGQLHRAIDLIRSTTPDKIGGNPRDFLIVVKDEQTVVEAVSKAYSFPGARVTIAAKLDLAEGEPFILAASDAALLCAEFEKHDGWTVEADGKLNAGNLVQPISLSRLSEDYGYRVAVGSRQSEKALESSFDRSRAVASYIARERETNAKRKDKGLEPRAFPTLMELAVHGSNLNLRLSISALTVSLADTSIEEVADERTLGVSDVEALASTLARFEADASGYLFDREVADAGLLFESYFGDDHFELVLPTRTGTDYNQVCELLAL